MMKNRENQKRRKVEISKEEILSVSLTQLRQLKERGYLSKRGLELLEQWEEAFDEWEEVFDEWEEELDKKK